MVSAPGAQDRPVRVCLISWTAFQPPRWQTVQYLRDHYRVDLAVLAPPEAKCPTVYDASGYFTPKSVGLLEVPDYVTLVPLRDRDRPPAGFDPRQLASFLRRFQPEVVWIHGEPLDDVTLTLCARRWFDKEPRLYQAAVENYQSLGHSLVAKLKNRLLLERVQGFLVCSDSTGLSVQQDLHIPARRIFEVYAPSSAPLPLVRRPRLGSEFRIGFAGRYVEEKGIRILLAALELLPEHFRLVTAGDGDPEFKDLLQAHPRVSDLGLLTRLEPLFAQVDVLVVPSLTTKGWKEQFGRVTVEAMSHAIPVVGSDSGSTPDVLGGAGVIYPEASPSALAEALMRLCGDAQLYTELSLAGERRFAEKFSIAGYATRLAEIFGLRPKTDRLHDA